MKVLIIEWRNLELNKGKYHLCLKTRKMSHKIFSDLLNNLKSKEIKITFNETNLSEQDNQQSNIINIDNKPFEQIIPQAKVTKNYYAS